MIANVIQLAELAEQPQLAARFGGKAVGLSRLVAAGLPVPAAIVIAANASAEEIASALPEIEALGAMVVVRSSASIEDGTHGAAPGIFLSELGVAPADVIEAVTRVRAAGTSDLVRAYQQATGVEPSPVAVSVVVQCQITSATARGTTYTRAPNSTGMLIEIRSSGDEVHFVELDRNEAPPECRHLDPTSMQKVVDGALAAEAAIGASETGADVEWLLDDTGAVWLVQARAVVGLSQQNEYGHSASAFDFTKETPQQTWRWDVTHNPAPLTPAQRGLVEWIEPRGATMRVVDGYLYCVASDVSSPVPSASELAHEFDEVIGPRLDLILAAVEDAPPDLAVALEAYREVHRIYTDELSPLVSSAKRAVKSEPAVPTSHVMQLATQVASGEITAEQAAAACSSLSPVWDVATPTYGEQIDLTARFVALARSPRQASAEQGVACQLAAVVGRVVDADDVFFYRAQFAVRRALLALAVSWELDAVDDVFYLPLSEILHGSPPHNLAERATAARNQLQIQARLAMPSAVQDGVPVPNAPSGLGIVLRGRGRGGVARGPIARARSGGGGVPKGAIFLARAVTPAMIFDANQCAAIITEFGGLLDHASALASELGIPCVVGCRGAWSSLEEGDDTWVDGETGTVIRLSHPSILGERD